MNGSGTTGSGGRTVSVTVNPRRGVVVGRSLITVHSFTRARWRLVGATLAAASLGGGVQAEREGSCESASCCSDSRRSRQGSRYVGLQAHGGANDVVSFRNVRIEDLSYQD
jgi:hypothetical protein